MAYADRDKQLAIHLYRWNVELSESLYWPLQTVEIAFRNAIAATLRDRFGAGWHLNGHFHRILAEEHRLKLRQAVARQKRKRKSERPTEDAVIADMPFGFWTSLLTARYDVPLKWNHNIRRSFPHIPRGCSRGTIAGSADRIRDIRNRIAHHEPILHLKLDRKYGEIKTLLDWISPDLRWFVEHSCAFDSAWRGRPPHPDTPG
ncbi:Abi family protein [Ferruginivarius sediminum]